MNNDQPSYTLGSAQVFYPMVAGLRHALPEHDAGQEQVAVDEGKEGGAGRITVRITRFGVHLLDADNLAGGVKWTVDALRYQGLIPEDNPQAICLLVGQKKVKRDATGTLIEISYP